MSHGFIRRKENIAHKMRAMTQRNYLRGNNVKDLELEFAGLRKCFGRGQLHKRQVSVSWSNKATHVEASAPMGRRTSEELISSYSNRPK